MQCCSARKRETRCGWCGRERPGRKCVFEGVVIFFCDTLCQRRWWFDWGCVVDRGVEPGG